MRVRLRTREKELLRDAAEYRGASMSEWAREALLAAADAAFDAQAQELGGEHIGHGTIVVVRAA